MPSLHRSRAVVGARSQSPRRSDRWPWTHSSNHCLRPDWFASARSRRIAMEQPFVFVCATSWSDDRPSGEINCRVTAAGTTAPSWIGHKQRLMRSLRPALHIFSAYLLSSFRAHLASSALDKRPPAATTKAKQQNMKTIIGIIKLEEFGFFIPPSRWFIGRFGSQPRENTVPFCAFRSRHRLGRWAAGGVHPPPPTSWSASLVFSKSTSQRTRMVERNNEQLGGVSPEWSIYERQNRWLVSDGVVVGNFFWWVFFLL